MSRGRAPFIICPLSAFSVGVDGEPPITPFDKEFCYDDLGDKSVGHIEYNADGVTWKFVSVSKDVNTYLESLKDTGIFDNAIAGVVSKELTYFLYNLDSRTIIFNDKLVYPNSYKYYSIRKGTSFITGRDYNGEMINICDMVLVETETGSGVIVSKPSIGSIAPDAEVVDGDVYIVEFFDATKRLISRDVFYAEYTQTFVGPLASDAAIGIKVVTTRPYPEEGTNASFLFRGEAIEQLSYLVILMYNNGDEKDITHEVGNIEVHGLNTVDTSNLTGSTPFAVEFVYNPPVGLSLSTTINVHVITDVTDNVVEVLPVYYIPSSTISSVVRRYFAITNTLSLYEITAKTNPEQNPTEYQIIDSIGNINSITREFNLGLFGQDVEDFSYFVKPITYQPMIGGEVLRIEYSVNGGVNFVNKYKSIEHNDIGTLSITQPENAIDIARDGVVPDKFRVRTIDGVYITDNINISAMSLFNKRSNVAGYIANKTTPVIIECFKENGIVGEPNYSLSFTKAFVAYFR